MIAQNKEQLIADFKKSENDVGSAEVQVIHLTDRISMLTDHFKGHPKDFGSKRGLLILVGRRRRFLKYLERHNKEKYRELIERLGLRK
jgi:small subunit ribosomal protein S15